jgi:hypothetical protein
MQASFSENISQEVLVWSLVSIATFSNGVDIIDTSCNL